MDQFSARRKLLRGTLSAPLVLTVASPSALARQSFEACLHRAGKDHVDGVDKFLHLSEHDTWLRRKVSIYKGKLTWSGSGEDFYHLPEKGYFRKSDGAKVVTFASGPTFDCEEHVLVYVDGDGGITGYGPKPDGGFPVSSSCWASFGGKKP